MVVVGSAGTGMKKRSQGLLQGRPLGSSRTREPPGTSAGGGRLWKLREMLASSLPGPLWEQSSQPLLFAKCHDVLTPCQMLHMGLWMEPCLPQTLMSGY